MAVSQNVADALEQLSKTQSELGVGRLDLGRRWMVQLYSGEMSRVFGGLSIVDKAFMPLGVTGMLKAERGMRGRWCSNGVLVGVVGM